ncbi:MAG: 6-pyruvoyl tetrahydropterin synthase family protein [Gemmatimonadota bacterium]
MPRVRVTRRVHFAAGHRLHNPELDESENRATFGACNNLHGHNYDLDVTVEGEVDPASGFVIDLGRLRDLVEAVVVRDVDHTNLNEDVEWMRGVNPTAENLVVQIWRRLEGRLDGATLVHLKLWETERNSVEYSGE